MTTTLYRKYRPGKFAEVIAQNHIKVTLQNEIESGKLAHAFLFSGPRGIGKTTIARILAKSLNCTKRKGTEPCCECESCLEIRNGNSLDLVEIDAASNRGIDEIRELREQTRYTPTKGNYKIFIIDEAHMLTTQAFNALLKTLEEPPAHAIFIMATTEIHKIPETIISRCQRFDFRKVPINDIASHLEDIAKQEKIKVETKVLENIARISEGYLRDAISLLGQILALGEKEISEEEASLVIPRSDWQQVLALLEYIFQGKTRDAILLINRLVEEGVDLEHFTYTVIESLRKILLAKVTADWQEVSWDFGEAALKSLTENVEGLSPNRLVGIIDVFMEAFLNLKKTKIVQLPLEMAVVKVIDNLGNGQDHDETPPSVASSRSKPEARSVGQPEASVKPAAVNARINLNQVKQKWPEVIEALKSHNHSLASFLMVGSPLDIEDDKIIVGFKFNFHYERIKEPKNLEIVKEVLAKIFSVKLSLEGRIDENLEENQLMKDIKRAGQKSDDMVNEVLNTLGGEVVS